MKTPFIDKIRLYWIFCVYLSFSAVFLNSCSIAPYGGSPQGLINKIESMNDKVQARQKSLTKDQWKQYDKQFRKLVDDCYDDFESEMTSKQQNAFWKACYKYSRIRLKNGFLNIFKANKGPETSDFKQFLESTKKHVKDLKLEEEVKALKSLIEAEINDAQ